MDAMNHYNHVTDAWREFMGNNLHFGYFEHEGVELAEATDALIEKMMGLCNITEGNMILDVGCGIGNPAFYIHRRHRCKVIGISTSERGVQLANKVCKEKGYHDVEFKVADGCSNGFPDNVFDIAWVMESSHLMADKKRLFRECFRVLKPNGTLLLCDLMTLNLLPILLRIPDIIVNFINYMNLIRVWGNADLNSLGIYCNGLIQAGFHDVLAMNITKETMPTLACWKKNALCHGDTAINRFSKKDILRFIKGCDTVEGFFKKGLVGYGMIRATK